MDFNVIVKIKEFDDIVNFVKICCDNGLTNGDTYEVRYDALFYFYDSGDKKLYYNNSMTDLVEKLKFNTPSRCVDYPMFMKEYLKPKFKVGDRVTINSNKIPECGNQKRFYYEGDICNIDKNGDYFVDVKTKTFPEGIKYWLSEEDLTLAESKPKWSVGTYVEFLTDRVLSDGTIVHKGIYEIVTYVKELEYIELNVGGVLGIWKFLIKDWSLISQIKWHENKPEENMFNIDVSKIDYSPSPEFYDGSRLSNYHADECGKIAKYGKSPIEGIYQYLQESNIKYYAAADPYKSGDFDEKTLEDVAEYMRNQPVVRYVDPIDYRRMFPYTWEECFNEPLKKRRITISNIKPIKININKKRRIL